MKIAIVHDYIKEYGGAERVLEEFMQLFPDAEIYTSVYLPRYLGPHKERFSHFKIHTSFLQYIPFKAKLISPFRLLAPFVFKHMDLSRYDVILVSQTGAYFPNLVHKGKAKLICYTHTPPRYLYGYATARDWKSNKIKLVVGSLMNHFLRIVDYNASKNVDQFVANSEEVRARIKKFYRKDAFVVYPPVDVPSSKLGAKKQGKDSFYLSGGRLARAKGTDIILQAFLKNKKRLKIFGRGFAGFEEELLSRIGKTQPQIEFLGEVTNEEKVRLMQEAQAFIFASFDEDFGITPVEAMGQGTPVIAYSSGGVKETVANGSTGVLYEPNTPEGLTKAIENFEKKKTSSDACRKQAEKFSVEKFDKHMKEVVSNARTTRS